VLLGRERECNQIDQLLADAHARRSASLVIRGDPGIGKSALLRYAEEQAGSMGVLRAVGVESESELPFAAVHELLGPIKDKIDALPEIQRAALSGALALGPPAQADRLTVYAAVLSLLAEAAEEQPLLCIIDDSHWIDSASAEAILFCARRIHAEGVVMLMAAREGERRRFDSPGVPDLVLDGLAPGAAYLLLDSKKLGLTPRVAEQLVRVTGGNPLALIELPRALSEAQRRGLVPLNEPLPVGQDVRDAFLGRVRRLPVATQGALLVAAACDLQGLSALVHALQTLGFNRRDLDEAEAAGLLDLGDDRFTFRHPLLRSAIYEAAEPAARRASHRAIAEALDERQSESRAWHLAAASTEADTEVAGALEQAAFAASARGAPAVAAWSFARAADFTVDEGERARRLLAAGTAAWFAGRSEDALEYLTTALQFARDPRLRADIQLQRGHALIWTSNVHEANDLLTTEAIKVAAVDRDRAALMMATAVMSCGMSGQQVRAVETGKRAVELAGDGPARIFAQAMLSISVTVRGEPTAHALLIQSQRELASADSPALSQLSGVIAHVLMYVEEYESSLAMLDRVIAARARGVLNPHALAARADVYFRLGRWVDSYADAAESVDLAREVGQRTMLPFCLGTLARVDAATGRDRESSEHAAEAVALVESLGVGSALTYAWSVQGFLELGRGRAEAAIAPLRRVAATTEIVNPGVEPWAPDLIEACTRSGLTADANEALDSLVARARMTGHAGAHAAAARCRGLLAADNDFESAFNEALEWHSRTPTPFERARTDLCYGERLRRVGRRIDARERLRVALATFESLGAEPWSEQARAELRATGERVRKREASTAARLTAQELQVAVLVADGGTNREVGARMMLSPRTIEFHLRNIYAKLGVRSRTELAKRVADKGANAIRHGS
jgi:DNA-binding CsgD family transcriptional regulator